MPAAEALGVVGWWVFETDTSPEAHTGSERTKSEIADNLFLSVEDLHAYLSREEIAEVDWTSNRDTNGFP